MAALSIQVPYPVFYDRDGLPLDNGRIYIGDANQDPITNPLATYYDEALTIPASQPLITSGGYIYRNGTPAQIYVDAVNFSISVKDDKGLLVYNFPDGTGIGVGANSILYQPPFIGGVTSNYTVADKLSQFVSVQDFGVVADGVTDDTTAFQTALNSGVDLQLAEGTMVIGQVTSSAEGQKIYGSPNTIIKHKNGVSGSLITIAGEKQIWSGFSLNGNAANVTYTYDPFEITIKAADCVVSDIRITDAISGGIRGEKGAERLQILNNYVENTGDFGIFVNDAHGSGADPAGGICSGNTVINFGSQGGGGGATTSVGIGIRSATGGWRIAENRVVATTSYTNSQLGIECWTYSNQMIVISNVIDMGVSNSGQFGLSVTGYGSIVSSNIILGTTSYGIEIIDRAVSCVGNVLRSPQGAGIAVNLNPSHGDPGDVITITGNTVENTASLSAQFAGIIVAGDPATNPIAVTISGNTIYGQSQGIVVDSQAVGYTITGNTLYNWGSSALGISVNGSDGIVSGNNVYRSVDVGLGKGGHIVINGDGVLVTGNRVVGNGQIDNAILIGSPSDNICISGNFITGATNAVFSTSSGAGVTVRDNVGDAGFALNAANYGAANYNSASKAMYSQGTTTSLGSFTVANLPLTGVIAGTLAYASNGRKAGEGAGAGTGVLAFYDAIAWRACDTGATVAA